MTPPLIVLGVSRSGTTLLRVVLDRSSGLAIPDESFFVPLLARRHGKTAERDAFLDDVARVSTLRDWGLTPGDVAPFLRSDMPTGEAIAAIFEAYAATAGSRAGATRRRCTCVTSRSLERLFPDAQYVHLIRDGRDAAAVLPRDARGDVHANVGASHDARAVRLPMAQGDRRRAGARTCGRLEPLPRGPLRGARRRPDRDRRRDLRVRRSSPSSRRCSNTQATWTCPRSRTSSGCSRPPTKGVRSWREEMATADIRAFEEIAGDLLAELGYEVTNAAPPRSVRAQPPGRRTTPASPRGTRRSRSCSAHRFGVAGTLALP